MRDSLSDRSHARPSVLCVSSGDREEYNLIKEEIFKLVLPPSSPLIWPRDRQAISTESSTTVKANMPACLTINSLLLGSSNINFLLASSSSGGRSNTGANPNYRLFNSFNKGGGSNSSITIKYENRPKTATKSLRATCGEEDDGGICLPTKE